MILLGEIGRPHGVRGLLRVRSFTAAPRDLAAYGPLFSEDGQRRFALTMLADDLARIEGVADRDEAQRLTGTKLFVPRDAMPEPEEEEFYLADLQGLEAVTEAGEALGRVRAVEDHGGGPFLVLDSTPERLVPFTRAAVPVVDVKGGRVVVAPPDEVEAKPE
ncbi:ribosome maturation factor RimM [Sabulicella glaciei]|uniref:Ribosome maturation factor RimM n=1 Tax=Sabulicella glaciei TaxID=2984948 RepID=A0ABT3NQR4_9PROT|nr:ribosome maturation factor RimM [Roseococcus sp. MDT2-1-1]MCW8084499.1 ribosome maturation factor RimM [Roseococcus sp. MDT2-1-1]